MSPAFTAVSLILLVITFAAGAFIGYLAIGGSLRSGRPRSRPKARQSDPLARALAEFQRRIERLEQRMTESDRRAVPLEEGQRGEDEKAEADGQETFKLDVDSVLPDVQRQLRDVVAEIRREHDAAGDDSNQRGLNGASEQDSITSSGKTNAVDGSGACAAEARGEVAFIERRSRLRHSFLCRQWIAPYDGNSMPDLEKFLYVQCNDISSVGISFFLDSDPECPMVVIRLESAKGPKYVTARVRRVTPSDARAMGTYTVGCQFLGTIHVDALPPWLNRGILRREKQTLWDGAIAPAPTKA